jgi:hypothetical protein
MKRCPQCNRTYTDDALSFCLDDGSPLVSASAPSSFDPGATVQYPQGRDTGPQPTMVYGPSGQMPGSTPPPPPPWSPMPPMAPQKRSVWPWILGIGAVLVFMGIGVLILIVALASMSNNNNNNSNNSNNGNSNRLANRNANASNVNANTRSTLSSFTDDFSTESWRVGSSQYGRTWYEDDEYHMHGNKGGYIVIYGPNTSYGDENSTVRVTTRSVDGESPDSGYGLLVHGDNSGGTFHDYGFLIYSGTSPKYAIVKHQGSTESKIVNWTGSSTIRTGTTPNQLEVRIRGGRLDFYVNGQFVTSITDSENFSSGRVGFYTSDTGEVAFDDLEISR